MGGFTQVFGGDNIFPVQPSYSELNYSANVNLAWPIEQAIAGVPVVTSIMDLNPSALNLVAVLPDARQVSQGFTAVFNNISAFITGIEDNVGDTILFLPSGTVWVIYLTDNSTQKGTWRVFQYGAGVSSANALGLAGAGLKAISTTLNEKIGINQQVANYAINNVGDRASCIEWAGGSGGVFTLPSPGVVGNDWFCYIKNAGSGILSVTTSSGAIDGGVSKSFNPNDSALIICDGTNFISIGYGQAITAIFSFVSIAVTGGNLALAGAQLNRVSYKFTGALTANQTITVPGTIQQYWVDNETTGAFTLTVTTGVGSNVTVGQGQRAILYCDGINVVNAVSGGGAPSFPDGSAAAPSITFASDLTLGLYKAGPEVLGFATSGLSRGSISAGGNWTIALPTAATALTVNGQVSIVAPPAGESFVVSVNNNTVGASFSDGTSSLGQYTDAAHAQYWGTLANYPFNLVTNSTIAINITGAGNVNIQSATAGGHSISAANGSVATIQNAAGADGRSSLRFINPANTKTWDIGVDTSGGATLGWSVRDVTRGATPLTVATTGGVTVATPASGTAFTVNGLTSGATPIMIWSDGTSNGALFINGNVQFGSSNNVSLVLITNNAGRLTINNAGSVAISAPTSGIGLQVTGVANSFTLLISGSSTAGQSKGLQVQAGTTAADFAMFVRNQAATINIMSLAGDGSGYIGGNGTTTAITFNGVGNVTLGGGATGDTLTVAPSATSGALIATSAALTSGAGASAGTLTNAPSAGNPTKWIKINDNGTIRSVPAW